MVIQMKNFINLYINNLTYNDLKKYIDKNYENISDDEIKIIYYYIKNRWNDIYNNDIKVWEELKMKLTNKTYDEIKKLYNKYSYLK